MLIDVLKNAQEKHVAVGHFNIADITTLNAIAAAARELNVPVIIGLAEGERAFIGAAQAAALVKSIREQYGQEIYVNADHTHSLEKALEAAKAGFDSVVYDRSELPFEQNIAETKEAVKQLKAINPNILIEGEIGNIGSGSEIHATAPELVLSTVEESTRFIKETGVDVLAPAVGTMHGLTASMASGEIKKRLNIERIAEIKKATNIFLTLHGASGTNDDDFKKAIQAGLTVIHINTELRVAWRKSLEAALAAKPDELAPYKIMVDVQKAVQEVVKSRLQLFNGR